MSITVKIYDNGDHTCLAWLPADRRAIAGCRGFTIRRVVQGSPDVYLHGFVGFSDNDKLDPTAPWLNPDSCCATATTLINHSFCKTSRSQSATSMSHGDPRGIAAITCARAALAPGAATRRYWHPMP